MIRFLSVSVLIVAAPMVRGQVVEGPTTFPPPITTPYAAPLPFAPEAPISPPGPSGRQSAPAYQPVYPAWSQGGSAPLVNLEVEDVFSDYQVWMNAEYMLMYFRKMPLSTPLVTTTSSAPGPTANILGVDPNTRVLFDQTSVEQDPRNGGRVTLGMWFDRGRSIGGEIVGLWVESPSGEEQAIRSTSNGQPLLGRPVVLNTGVPAVYDIAYPGAVRGLFSVETHQLLQSLEGNLLGFAFGGPKLAGTVLVGGRFINLEEDVNMLYSVVNLVPMPAFGGQNLTPGTQVNVIDRFQTINQFSGGQIGGRLESNFGRFFVGVTGKVAFGVNVMTLRVDGVTNRTDNPSVYGAGMLANLGNVGRYQETQYAYVPEGTISFGWYLTPRIKLSAGYNFLYISDVVRPGQQISNRLNPAGVPIDQLYGTSAVTRTPPTFTRTDFWAEGILLGIDVRY